MKRKIMIGCGAVIAGLLFSVVAAFGQYEALYRTFKLTPNTVGIACKTGDKPIVTVAGVIVMVGCPVKP